MARRPQTFLFADISGYSRLSEIEGDEAAAELAVQFASEVSALAAQHRVEVVKSVGDSVMVRSESADAIVRLGLRLNGDRGGLPPIHAGVHTGFAVERDGDWWGTTVNVAARIAAAAGAGQLLITEATRSAVGDLGPARLRGLGMLHLKNISSPVGVYSASERQTGAAPRAGQARRVLAAQLSLFDRERIATGSLVFEG